MKVKYVDLKPCTDMIVYRDLEKLFSDLCRKEIGITTAIDYINEHYVKNNNLTSIQRGEEENE